MDLRVKGDQRCTEPYLEAVGSLMFLKVDTRPELAYAVWKLSKYFENPGQIHYNSLEHATNIILSKKFGIFFGSGENSLVTEVYEDADWEGDAEGRNSVSGWIVMMGGAKVS